MAVKLLLWRLRRWVYCSRDRERFQTFDVADNVAGVGGFLHGLVADFSDGVVVGCRTGGFQRRR